MATTINDISREVHGVIVSDLLSSIEYRFDDGKEYLTNEENLRALLGYAKLGPDPYQAVLEALSFTVGLWKCSGMSIDMISYFSGKLVEIDLSRTIPVVFSDPIPKLPNLRKATIMPTTNHLDLIRHSPGLQHLSVSLEYSSEWSAFVSTVSLFQLKTLDISYKSAYGEKLHHREWAIMELKEPCQTVEHLVLRGDITLTHSVRLLVSSLQSLQKLTLKIKLCDYNVDELKEISQLDIIDVFSSPFAIIEQLKGRIKSLEAKIEDRDRIMALASFSELRHFKISATKNFRDSVGVVVDKLESLTIGFPFFLSLSRGRPFPTYDKLEIAPLISSLEKANNLLFLCIDKVQVSGSDVGKILAVVGTNLDEFHICVDWQRENGASRIETILKSVACYCPNLRVLKLLEDLSRPLPNIIASKTQKQNCLAELKKISNASRRFASHSKIESIILNRFKVKRREGEFVWDTIIPPFG